MRRLIACLCLAGACSWFQMERAPKDLDVVRLEPRCTGTSGFAAEDFVIAAVHGLSAALWVSQTEDGKTQAAANVLLGALHVASGVTGLGWAGECREVRARRDIITTDQADRLDRMERPPPAPRVRVQRVPRDAGVPVELDAGPDAP